MSRPAFELYAPWAYPAIQGRDLYAWIKESNRIEDIKGVTEREYGAFSNFLDEREMTSAKIAGYVYEITGGAPMRLATGQDVTVGVHEPPPGGASVGFKLDRLVEAANEGDDPWAVHQDYECLHPFMDGNGRSGRALWLWQMLRITPKEKDYEALVASGFLHIFYYQTLTAWRLDDAS